VLAQKWRDDLHEAIATYSRSRHRTPSVRVTLIGGEVLYVMRVDAGSGDRLLTLDVYPGVDDVLDRLVDGPRDADGEARRVTPDVMLVEPERIAKVELLYEPPEGRRDVGFQAPTDDDVG
jgi:hypothetical protein